MWTHLQYQIVYENVDFLCKWWWFSFKCDMWIFKHEMNEIVWFNVKLVALKVHSHLILSQC